MDVSPGRVLIVDDLPANLRLLKGILKVGGYEVATASCGHDALTRIATHWPDVVLLDAMMPEMDGFETCRRIKSDPETSWLPVVMVTALQEAGDRIHAIEAGADDFLTKPVDEVEVVARVKSLVRVKRQREALEKSYQELRRAESMRDGLTAMLVHDLRTPLTAILGAVETLRVTDLDTMQVDMIDICARSSSRLMSLISDLLDVSKMESGEMKLHKTQFSVTELVQEALGLTLPFATRPHENQESALERKASTHVSPKGGEVEVEVKVPSALMLEGDRDLLSRVLVNLLSNAARYAAKQGYIRVAAEEIAGESTVAFSISDNGPGIKAEDQERIFDKFGQAETAQTGRRFSTGLGLTFCRLAIETHGGRIWVESTPGEGSTFHFTIPQLR